MSKTSACAALRHCRLNAAATINEQVSASFFCLLSYSVTLPQKSKTN